MSVVKTILEKKRKKLKGEDPCWDNYEMVGLKPNGDPNCVGPVKETSSIQPSDKENLDEISKDLANRYMWSAMRNRKDLDDKMFTLRDRQDTLGHNNRNKITKLLKKSAKRTTGIDKALSRVIHKEEAEQVNEISQNLRDKYVQRAVTAHGGYNMARRNTTGADKEYFARKEKNTAKGISRALSDKRMKKEDVNPYRALEEASKYTDPRVDKEMKATKKEYEHRAKHYAAKKAGDEATAAKEHSRMRKFQSFASKINAARRADDKTDYGSAIAKDYKDQEAKRGIGKVRD